MTTIFIAIIALALLPAAIPVLFLLITIAMVALPFAACALSAFLLASGGLEGVTANATAAAVCCTSGLACAAIIHCIQGR